MALFEEKNIPKYISYVRRILNNRNLDYKFQVEA